MAMQPGDGFEVVIDRLASGGDGVGRGPDGITVFVPLAAPGDRLRVQVAEARRRFLRAEIVEVVGPGPARVAPRCPAFGRCGGCTWQHVDYTAQIDAKRAILSDAMRRIGGHVLAAEPPIAPSTDGYGYRARARVLERDGVVGYRARRSHELIGVEECPVLVPALEESLDAVRTAGASGGRLRDGPLREWEVAIGSRGPARVVAADETASAHAGRCVDVEVDGETVSLSPGTFGQANALLWGALHHAVVEAAGRGARALELFAGAGFFTLALARHFDEVEAVESSRPAVADLRRNLARAGTENVAVIRGRAESAVPRRIAGRPDVVVVDPPRSGLPDRLTREIAKLAPRRVVYLSCDPATLARDTARLVEAGYALVHLEGFDLFPQTAHLEALAVLDRQDVAPR